MKSIKVVFSIGLALTLAGCAYPGYQRGYVGYNTGYSIQRSYAYPDHGYSRQGYGQYYSPPIYPHGYDRDHHNDWRGSEHRMDHQPTIREPGISRGGVNQWEGQTLQHGQGHIERHIETAPTRSWAPETQNHRSMSDQGSSSQPMREFSHNGFARPGHGDRHSDTQRGDEGSNRHGHDHGRH